MRSRTLPEVSLAIAPLGSSNDISRSVGWGSFKEDYWSNSAYVPNMLKTVGLGRPVYVDCWSVRVACDKSKSLISSGLPESFLDSQEVRPPPAGRGSIAPSAVCACVAVRVCACLYCPPYRSAPRGRLLAAEERPHVQSVTSR